MDWSSPILILLFPLIAAALWWAQRRSLHPMTGGRKAALLAVRTALVLLSLLALASPAMRRESEQEAVIFVLDHSQSLGEAGARAVYEKADELASSLPSDTYVGFVSAGATSQVLRLPTRDRDPLVFDVARVEDSGHDTDLAGAVSLARSLFPPATTRRLVLIGDGLETKGDLAAAADDAALAGVAIDAVPVAGPARPDVRVVRVRPSRSRLHEGAQLRISADIASSIQGAGRVRLFENGIEVDAQPLEVKVGEQATVHFDRTPEERNLYKYRVAVEGFEGDSIPENDASLALVDVRGRPMLLYIEGEESEAHYLTDAMAREGIRLVSRTVDAMPNSLQDLAGYDGVVFSDVPAHKLTEKHMTLVRDYVEQLGGGFMMIGGRSSFGVGGYYRTPIEDVLPVKMKAPDKEEKYATALALVIDRSGSMGGQKIEICKSAAIATVELLSKKDYIGVVAFDSRATWVVPMTKVTSPAAIAGQVATVNAGGGTNIYPGMSAAREALAGVKAKVKHMIVLTDGQTGGTGYPQLAAALQAEGVTVSTVGIGSGADLALLQSIARAGGGEHYATADPTAIPRIFTQDAMVHMGKLIREQDFVPKQVERHTMLAGWPADKAPPLLGYVKTHRKATAQVPMVTDLGDPLLAHWRYGLGKVTAFTSDCKSRWSALWLTQWQDGYNQFWAQVLREMARQPQGQRMDIQLARRGRAARIEVDLLEDAAQYKNDASVEADVYFVPAHALGSALKPAAQVKLEQEGPGRYAGRFTPDEPGVYLVRARSGADMVSAGLVENVSSEAATGRVDTGLLEKVCATTGGAMLSADATGLPASTRVGHSHFVELTPALLRLLLLLFLADVAIRRWENVRGMGEFARKLVGRG